MPTEDMKIERLKELVAKLKPASAHSFVNGPYPKSPFWSVGYIDNWQEPGLGWIEVHDSLDVLIKRVKRELRKQNKHNFND